MRWLYSACATVFMAGNRYQEAEGWGPVISRHLHVQGRLGFHAPFIFNFKDPSFKDKSVEYSMRKIEEAFRAGLKATRDMADLGIGVNMGGCMSNYDIMPLRLIFETLFKGPEEVFLIDTIIEAKRYRIYLFGAKSPPRIGDCELQNFCSNHHYSDLEFVGSRADRWLPPDQPCKKPVKVFTRNAETYLYFDGYGGEGAGFCVVKSQGSKSILPLALLWQILSGTGFPNHFFCDSWVVGFWRADHEEHIIGLGSRACTVAKVVRGPVRAQGSAADVPALRDGVDWSWRSQECSADG
jgi:hypothetical protein